MITQEDNLILQSYITVSLLAELGNNSFFRSNYFREMHFGSPDIKMFLEKNGIDNQGSAIMCLYAMLVVPFELIRNNYPVEFSLMNAFLKTKTKNVKTNYQKKAIDSDYMYHLRNAVAHCRITFKEGESIIFIDSNHAKKEDKRRMFYGELSLLDLNMFIQNLQIVIQMKVIKEIQSRIKNNGNKAIRTGV